MHLGNTLKVKYSSLKPFESSNTDSEENIYKLELAVCQDELLRAKEKNKSLNESLALHTLKLKELEKHAKSLASIISEKDILIAKLWDEVVKLNPKKNVNKEEILEKLNIEQEITSEGQVGELFTSVGKSPFDKLVPNFTDKREMEIQEIRKLRNELSESQRNTIVLNDRVKELTDRYLKLELEAHEMREKIKAQKENALYLTQQVLKISNEKESSLISACLDNDELNKKFEKSEIERKRLEEQLDRVRNEMNERISKEKMTVHGLKSEILVLQQDNSDLKDEIQGYLIVNQKKEIEMRKLNNELEESRFLIIKLKESPKPEALELFNENLDLKNKIKDLEEQSKLKLKELNEIVEDEYFQFDSLTQNNLISIFGKDSKILFDKFQQILNGFQDKVKNQRGKIIELTTHLSNSQVSSEIYLGPLTKTPEAEILDPDSSLPANLIFYSLEKLKIELENQKNAKRKARAEKEQAKLDLAHCLVELSEINSELLELKLQPDGSDILSFLHLEAQIIESMLMSPYP